MGTKPLRLVSTPLEVFSGAEKEQPVVTHSIASTHPHIPEAGGQTAICASCFNDEIFVLVTTPFDDQSILQLRTFHLTGSQRNPAAHQIIFPAPILDTIHLHFSQHGVLTLQACTLSGVIYRILLPLELLASVDEIPARWISECRLLSLGNSPRDVYRQGLLTDMHTSKDGLIALVACKDGRVLKVVYEDEARSREKISGTWQETVLRLDNFFSRFFTRSASSSTPTQVLSASSYCRSNQWKHTLGFTVSRDRKLRVWDLGSDACIRVVDLPLSLESLERGQLERATNLEASNGEDSPANALFSARPVVRTFADAENLFLLVYIPAPQPSGNFIACYQVHFEGASLLPNRAGASSVGHIELIWEKACDAETRGWDAELRDLTVIPHEQDGRWTIWGLWDAAGECLVKQLEAFEDFSEWETVSLPVSYSPLHGVALDEDLKAVYRADDLASFFLQRIIEPGRFSRSSLEESLDEYGEILTARHGKLPERASVSASIPIREQIAALVGSTIELEEDASTGAPLYDAYFSAMRKEWTTFINLVEEHEAKERWPIAFACGGLSSKEPFVASRRRLALPVVEDPSSTQLRMTSKSARENVGSKSSDSSTLAFVNKLFKSVRPAALQAFERDLLGMLETLSSTPPEGAVDSVWTTHLQGAWEDEEAIEEDFAMLSSEEVKEGIVEALQSLRQIAFKPGPASITPSMTELEVALCSDAIIQISSDRLALARRLMLLCAVLHVGHLPLEEDLDGGPTIEELLADSVAVYHGLYTFDALARTEGAVEMTEGEPKYDIDGGDASTVALEMENLQFSTDPANGSLVGMNIIPSNLVHACLLCKLLKARGSQTELPLSLSARIHHQASAILTVFLGNRSDDVQTISLTPAQASFADTVIKLGYPSAAAAFIRLFPRTPASHHLLARCHILSNEIEQAAAEYEQVGPVFLHLSEEKSDCASGLLDMLPPAVRDAASSDEARFCYYRRVTASFQHRGSQSHFFTAFFAKKAIDSAPTAQADTRALNEARFTSLLALEWFEDAYAHVMAIPSLEQQRRLIPDLISQMCEQGHVEALLSFNFASLQVDVVSTLSFKARNSKTLEEVNFYFDLLYAFYVKRGDLKNAGATMWQMGTRIRQMARQAARLQGDETDEEYIRQLSIVEARCYLASVNVLSQLDSKDAWFAHDAGGAEEDEAMESKLTRFVPASTSLTKSKDTLKIVHLQDIQRRYQIRLAQLELLASRPQYSTSILLTNRNDAGNIVSLLTGNGDFQRALTLARLLDADRTQVYLALTDRCLELAQWEKARKTATAEAGGLTEHPLVASLLNDEDVQPTDRSAEFLQGDARRTSFLSETDQCTAWKGSTSVRGWKYLHLWLRMEESDGIGQHASCYYLAVLNRVLHWQQWDVIPAWLLRWLQTNGQELLIKSLLAHDLLVPALEETLSMVISSTKSVGKLQRKRKLPGTAGEVYLPYLLMDELLRRAEEGPSNPSSAQSTTATSDSLMERRRLVSKVRQAVTSHKEHLANVQLRSIREQDEDQRRQRQYRQQQEDRTQRQQDRDLTLLPGESLDVTMD